MLLSLADESSPQHERTEYTPPPSSTALQQHLERPLPAAHESPAVLQRPITAAPFSRPPDTFSCDCEDLQEDPAASAADPSSQMQLDISPAAVQMHQSSCVADELPADISSDAEAIPAWQGSSGDAGNVAAVGEASSTSTEQGELAVTAASGSPRDHAAAAATAVGASSWALETSQCTVENKSEAALHEHAVGDHHAACGQLVSDHHAESATTSDDHLWGSSTGTQANHSELELARASVAADYRLSEAEGAGAVPEAVVSAQLGRPDRSPVHIVEGFFLENDDDAQHEVVETSASQVVDVQMHRTEQEPSIASSKLSETAVAAAYKVAAAHAATEEDKAHGADPGDLATAEESTAEAAAGDLVKDAAEVAAVYGEALKAAADPEDETAAVNEAASEDEAASESPAARADEASSEEVADTAAGAADKIEARTGAAAAAAADDDHETAQSSAQASSSEAGVRSDPATTAGSRVLDASREASGLAVDHTTDVESHSEPAAQTAPDECASLSNPQVLQQQEQQQGLLQAAGMQQAPQPPGGPQGVEQQQQDVGQEADHQGDWQHDQVVAAMSSQQIQPEAVEAQQHDRLDPLGSTASDISQHAENRAGHLPTGDHSQSQLQLQEQHSLQRAYDAAADLEKHEEQHQHHQRERSTEDFKSAGLSAEVGTEQQQQQQANLQGSVLMGDIVLWQEAHGHSSSAGGSRLDSAPAAAAMAERSEPDGNLSISPVNVEAVHHQDLQEQQELPTDAAPSAAEAPAVPAEAAEIPICLQDVTNDGSKGAVPDSNTAAEAAEADDGFIYQDEDNGSSSCSSPVAPAAEADVGIQSLLGSAAQPEAQQLPSSHNVAAAAGWYPDIDQQEGALEASRLSGWSDSNHDHAAANGPASAAAAAGLASSQSPTFMLHHSNRPIHSKTRPAASPSPVFMARFSGSSATAGGLAPAGYMAGPRLRPESAPARRALSSTSRHVFGPQGLVRGCSKLVWVPGGATATEQHLVDVNAQQTTTWGCSSITSSMQLPSRPHTSHGIGSNRNAVVSPSRRPAWVQPTGVALRTGSAAWSSSGGSKAALRPASAERAAWGPAGPHTGLQQQQQKMRAAATNRPSSAELYGHKHALQDSNAKRPNSSKPSGSCQQQRAVSVSSMGRTHAYDEIASLEQAYGFEPRHTAASGDACSSSWQQQQQQRRVGAQPGAVPWDESPIPLNIPNSMPIAAATQSYEVLLAAKANAQGAGHPALCPTARPRTAGSAGSGAICRDAPGFSPRTLKGNAAAAGTGVYSSAIAGSNVYLVDVLQRIRQANNICRKLGVAKQYRLGKGSTLTWQQQQILVEMWVLSQDHPAEYEHAEAEHVQFEQVEQQQEQHGWQLRDCLTLEQFNSQFDRLAARAQDVCRANSPGGSRSYSPNRARRESQAAADTAGSSQASRQAWIAAGSPGAAGACLQVQSGVLLRPQSAYPASSARASISRLLSSSEAAVGQSTHVQHRTALGVGHFVQGVTMSNVQGSSMLPYAVPAWMEEYL